MWFSFISSEGNSIILFQVSEKSGFRTIPSLWEMQQPNGLSALDSGSKGPGSSPGWSRVVFLGSHFTLTVLPYTQEYKWVPMNCQ